MELDNKCFELIKIFTNFDVTNIIQKRTRKVEDYINKQIQQEDYYHIMLGAYIGYGILEGLEPVLNSCCTNEHMAIRFFEYGKKAVKRIANDLINNKDYVNALTMYTFAEMSHEYSETMTRFYHDDLERSQNYIKHQKIVIDKEKEEKCPDINQTINEIMHYITA